MLLSQFFGWIVATEKLDMLLSYTYKVNFKDKRRACPLIMNVYFHCLLRPTWDTNQRCITIKGYLLHRKLVDCLKVLRLKPFFIVLCTFDCSNEFSFYMLYSYIFKFSIITYPYVSLYVMLLTRGFSNIVFFVEKKVYA